MSLTFDLSCLYSTVKNTSGVSKKFGFLPPHGRELAANEEYTVFGNILEALTRLERVTDRRHHQAFAAAIDRGDLAIINTPSPILLDASTGDSKMFRLSGGNLTTVDPCWEASLSDSDSDLLQVPA